MDRPSLVELEEPRLNPGSIDAEIAVCDARSHQTKRAGALAFARLLNLAEERDSGRVARIARLLAATDKGQAFQCAFFELRAMYIAISDDMLV